MWCLSRFWRSFKCKSKTLKSAFKLWYIQIVGNKINNLQFKVVSNLFCIWFWLCTFKKLVQLSFIEFMWKNLVIYLLCFSDWIHGSKVYCKWSLVCFVEWKHWISKWVPLEFKLKSSTLRKIMWEWICFFMS